MSAPGMTSAVRAEGFRNLQLNAGIFVEDFDYSAIATVEALKTAIQAAVAAGKSLGMTNGGGSFVIGREFRKPAVDGLRYPYKGDSFIDSMDPRLTGTLVEPTADNMKRLLGTVTVTTSGNKTTISVHTAIDTATDYIPSLCWIGDIADGSFVIIELKNAFNTADVTMTFKDKGEMNIPFEFHAHQDEVDDYDTAPFSIVYLKPAA